MRASCLYTDTLFEGNPTVCDAISVEECLMQSVLKIQKMTIGQWVDKSYELNSLHTWTLKECIDVLITHSVTVMQYIII